MAQAGGTGSARSQCDRYRRRRLTRSPGTGKGRGMNAATQVFALLGALFHVAAFAMESLLFRRPQVRRIFLGRADVAPDVFLWAFNQGFYNLFVAAGAIGGVIAYRAGSLAPGRVLTLYACGIMAAAGLVLYVSNRQLWRGALAQALPPAIALLAFLA